MPLDFTDVKILDNYYQTSSFYPMPIMLISTFSESGEINLGPYSLCFPHITTGKDQWSMMLICRGNSNTSVNIQRTKVCSINFIPHKRKFAKNCVKLGYPGDTTEQKMPDSVFGLMKSDPYKDPSGKAGEILHPDIVKESVQVFQCTWDESHPLRHNEDLIESHFLLHIDRILMKEKWHRRLLKGKGFPRLPINYGFRDNTKFWFAHGGKPFHLPLRKGKGNDIMTIKYAAGRYDPSVEWEDEACAKIVKVPSIFLKTVIAGTVKVAKEEGITVITPEFMDKVRNKRAAGK